MKLNDFILHCRRFLQPEGDQSMEARIRSISLAILALCSIAATDRSRNFVVTAATPEIARQVVRQAEICRHKLAVEWLGKPLPDWKYPCTVSVKVGQIGAGGATTFIFDRGNVGDFKMNIQGSLERILDSVIPHEVNHTIFAEYFRRPLPRWADEGAATFVEDESERRRQMLLAMQVLRTPRRIPMRNLLSIMEYPKDMTDVLHLYAEGYVLVELLIQSGGRGKFLTFLKTAHVEGWDRAFHAHYGYRGVDPIEREWGQWVLAGCPARNQPAGTMLADASKSANPQQPRVVARSQAPEREPVSVEDAVPPRTMRESVSNNSGTRRGTGLTAPRLPNRSTSSEPRMIADVDLGEAVPLRTSISSSSMPEQYADASISRVRGRPLSRAPRGRSEVVNGEESEVEIEPSEVPDLEIEEDMESSSAQEIQVASNEVPEEETLENEMLEEAEATTRPSTQRPPKRTGSRPGSASPARSPRPSLTVGTPALRADCRPELGQAQPFPRALTR